MKIVIQHISAEETRDLRHRILRPNQSPSACVYPGDDEGKTGHFGAFQDGELIGVASIFCETHPDVSGHLSWRIRGMATDDFVRGKGFGVALLEACIQYAKSNGGGKIWCNARSTAAGFYKKHGFQAQGDEFPLPGIGAHYLMTLEL